MLAITRPPVPTPYSVSIYPNESLISLLARTSADLGFTSTTTLLGVLKLTERQVLEGDIDTRKLAEFLRVPPEKLGPAVKMIDPEEGVWRFNTLQVPETYIDRQYMRVCPVCIGASKSHLQHWSLRPFPICVDHKVRLLSRCSQCDKAYRWSQIPRFSCECGLNVTQATCKPATEIEHQVASYFINQMVGRGRIPEKLPTFFVDADAAELFRIALCLGSIDIEWSRVKIRERPTMGSSQYLEMAALGVQRIENWDELFVKKLVESVARWGDQTTAHGTTEKLWRHVTAAKSSALTSAVGDVLVKSLDENFYHAVAKSIELRGASIKSLSVTDKEAREILNLSEDDLKNLKKGGLWAGMRTLGRYGKSDIYFRSDIEALKESWAGYDTVAETAARSGLSAIEVRELHHAGLMQSAAGLATNQREILIRSDWFAEIDARLSAGLPSIENKGSLLTLGEVKRMATRRDLPLQHVFELLNSGKLRPTAVTEGVGLNRLLFDHSEVVDAVDALHVEVYSSWPMRAIARHLSVPDVALYVFAGRGAFGRVVYGGYKGKSVGARDFAAFEQKYISCVALSKAMGTEAIDAREMIKARGVLPKHVAEVHEGTFSLYLRADVRKVAKQLGVTGI